METLGYFLANCPTRKFDKGEVIIFQDEVPRSAYGVKRGIVKIYNLTASGEEKSIAFGLKNDIFPIDWIFSRTKRTLFYYQAHTACELYIINKQNFMDYVETDVRLAPAVFNYLVDVYISNAMHVNALAQTKAYMKLLSTLRNLCLWYGEDTEEDCVRIKIPLTQYELANFMGLTRETTVVELNKLKKLNILSRDHQCYTINTAKLNRLIEDEYNPGITMRDSPEPAPQRRL